MPISDIPTVFVQEHSIETGFGGRVSIAMRAPLLTLTPPAPGGSDTPHGEIYIPVGDTAIVEDASGTPIALPSGALIRVGINRQGLVDLCTLAGQYAGYLFNAYPPVP